MSRKVTNGTLPETAIRRLVVDPSTKNALTDPAIATTHDAKKSDRALLFNLTSWSRQPKPKQASLAQGAAYRQAVRRG
jgi:hypothetical protein